MSARESNHSVFKPDLWSKLPQLAWGYVGSIAVGAAVLYLSTALYAQDRIMAVALWAAPVVTIVGFIVTAYAAVARNPVRLEVNGQTLSYFSKGRLAHKIDLPAFRGAYDQRLNKGRVTSQNLYLTPVAGGDQVRINCSRLPEYQFEAMVAMLKQRGLNE